MSRRSANPLPGEDLLYGPGLEAALILFDSCVLSLLLACCCLKSEAELSEEAEW